MGCPVNSRKLQQYIQDIVSAHLLACLQFQHANFDGPQGTGRESGHSCVGDQMADEILNFTTKSGTGSQHITRIFDPSHDV